MNGGCARQFRGASAPRADDPLEFGSEPYRATRGRLNRKISSPIGRLDYARVKIVDDLVEPFSVGGASLLSSIEKGEAEQLALLRQNHEITLQTLVQNVRFLQWKHAQESTNALLKSRASAYERYKNYLRLLGQTPDGTNAPDNLALNRSEITEATFDDLYTTLVSAYDLPVPTQTLGKLQLAQGSSPSSSSAGAPARSRHGSPRIGRSPS